MRSCFAVSVFALLVVFTSLLTITGCGGSHVASNSTSPAAHPSPSPAPAPSPSPAPGTPSGTVIDNVEDSTNWLTCGACGNTGATGAVATYSFTPGMASPSEDGRSTQFAIAASVAFSNAYFYQQQTPVTSQIKALTYEFDLYIPSGMENAPQAIEFECQQTVNGWVYNFAWQAEYAGAKAWRIFDYGLKRWDTSGIPFTGFAPNTWHHIVAEYHNDTANHVVWHDALVVDGVRFPVNISHNAAFTNGRNQFSNAFQLDSNSQATPYHVYVDRMRVMYQ